MHQQVATIRFLHGYLISSPRLTNIASSLFSVVLSHPYLMHAFTLEIIIIIIIMQVSLTDISYNIYNYYGTEALPDC